jgi:hypothetical protein
MMVCSIVDTSRYIAEHRMMCICDEAHIEKLDECPSFATDRVTALLKTLGEAAG